MKEKRNKITSRQLMTFIISAQVGMGVFLMPSRLANEAGHDGWITVIILCIISIIISILMVKLMERYNNKSIFDINIILYGKIIGTFLNVLLISYLVMKLTGTIRYFTEVIQTTALKMTPQVVITVLIITPSTYMVWNGLKPICRFANLIYICMFFIVLLLAVNISDVKAVFLMPVGISGLKKIMYSVISNAYSFLPFTNLVIIYPMITDKDNTMKYTISANIISAAFFIMVIVVLTGFFGENMIMHIVFPLYYLAQSYSAPIFDRIDLFFLAIWFPALGMTMRMYLFASFYSINKLLGIKRTTLSLIISLSIFVLLSRLIKDYVHLVDYAVFRDYIGMPFLFGLSLLDYTLSFIKKKETV